MNIATIQENDRVEQITIATMPPGTQGWVVSWAVFVAHDWTVWLSKTFPPHDKPGGTVNTFVSRLDNGDYTVRTPRPSGGWTRRALGDQDRFVPVAFFEAMKPT